MDSSMACYITCQLSTKSRFIRSCHVIFRSYAKRNLACLSLRKKASNLPSHPFDTYNSRTCAKRKCAYSEDVHHAIPNHSHRYMCSTEICLPWDELLTVSNYISCSFRDICSTEACLLRRHASYHFLHH